MLLRLLPYVLEFEQGWSDITQRSLRYGQFNAIGAAEMVPERLCALDNKTDEQKGEDIRADQEYPRQACRSLNKETMRKFKSSAPKENLPVSRPRATHRSFSSGNILAGGIKVSGPLAWLHNDMPSCTDRRWNLWIASQ